MTDEEYKEFDKKNLKDLHAKTNAELVALIDLYKTVGVVPWTLLDEMSDRIKKL